jgi:outer membrane protein OmpA-like peptidoglycan-associated protein
VTRSAMMRLAPRSLRTPATYVALLCLSLPAAARADDSDRLSIRGELGLGTMLSNHQREAMDYDLAGQLSVRPGLALVDALAVQLAVSAWAFPSGSGWGRVNLLGGGLRLQPQLGKLGRLLVDANLGLGNTGGDNRLAFDAGLGFDFGLDPRWALGPVLRYGQVVAANGDIQADARFWSLGISLTVRFAKAQASPEVEPEPEPAPPPPESDRDGDGVPDGADLCPDDPAGEHADPRRPGCPRPDSDADGVFDDEDHCPSLPQGEYPDPERPGCPDGDDDQDRVLNHRDQCRTQHAGYHPDPARPGCPLPDRDNDTVPDVHDACPDKPGAPHPDPKRNGCPSLVKIEDGMIRIMRPVYFATNKDRILPKSYPVLTAVADALRATPEIRLVLIEGHTDDRGKPDFNLDLSERRAEGVRQWLIDNGIEASRLGAKGYGDTRPVAPNPSRAGRDKNRRVEFLILDPPTAMVSP